MASRQQYEITRLGLYGLAPFVVSAVALWLSPWLLPQYIALDFHQLALVYGAVVVAYLAGAGQQLSPQVKSPRPALPGYLIMLGAFIAILPNGVFIISVGAAWRHFFILLLLIYVLMRDLGAVSMGAMPRWYGALRTRLTFWAGLAIVLIISRLILWGFY